MQRLTEQGNSYIVNPLDIINSLFDKDRSLCNVEEFFKEKLSSDNEIYTIPSLNDIDLHSLPSGTLVRFRCMIQDIFDPELYLALFEAKDPTTNSTIYYSSKYKEVTDVPDGLEIDFNAPSTVTKECQTLYCTSVPAENKWSKEAFTNKSQYELKTDTYDKQVSRNSCKRTYNAMEETDIINCEDAMDFCASKSEDNKQDAKKSKSDKFMSSDTSSNGSSSTTVGLSLPLPDGKCCLVKVYDNLDSYHVTDMFEFIGILTVDPSLAHHSLTNNGSEVANTPDLCIGVNVAETKAHHPPPSLVPRLHCIVAHKMGHSNPLLPRKLDIPVTLNDMSELYGTVISARSSLIDLLTTALMGDKLAAEYMLLNLMSTVHARHGLMPLGKFSLNLINPSIGKVSGVLQGIVQNLLPKSHLLPMSLTNMNTLTMTPKKNFEANRLEAGLLQLTAGTHLILDETLLTAGQLNNNGCLNLQALTNVLTWQKVKYDFQYHIVEISCDLPILVLSEGKSLLQVDCNLPVKATSSPDSNILQSLEQTPLEHLNKLRIYLGLCRLMRYQLTADVQNKLEQDFVEMRKTDAHMNAELFHFMLDMARLLSLSSGHTELQLDTWQKLKAMEVERRARLNEVPSPNQ